MLPKFSPQMVEMLKETEMIGETPRPTFVLSVSPNASTSRPMI